jgi:hypothetical protein
MLEVIFCTMGRISFGTLKLQFTKGCCQWLQSKEAIPKPRNSIGMQLGAMLEKAKTT